MTTITIYVLYDDREPGKWRYVGQARDAAKRLRNHRKQMTAGIPPANLQMATLATVDAAAANAVERSFIDQFVKDGHALANVRDNPQPIEYPYQYPIGPKQPRSPLPPITPVVYTWDEIVAHGDAESVFRVFDLLIGLGRERMERDRLAKEAAEAEAQEKQDDEATP